MNDYVFDNTRFYGGRKNESKRAFRTERVCAYGDGYSSETVVLVKPLAYFPRCARARAVMCKLAAIRSGEAVAGYCHWAKIARSKSRLVRSSVWALSGWRKELQQRLPRTAQMGEGNSQQLSRWGGLLRRATFLARGGWWPLLASCWTTRTSGTKREALSRIAIVKAFRALDRRLLSACGGSPTAGSDVLRAVCLPPDHLPLSVKFDTVAAWPECNQKHLYFLTSVKFYLAITTP